MKFSLIKSRNLFSMGVAVLGVCFGNLVVADEIQKEVDRILAMPDADPPVVNGKPDFGKEATESDWYLNNWLQFEETARRFVREHPRDPRRWDVLYAVHVRQLSTTQKALSALDISPEARKNFKGLEVWEAILATGQEPSKGNFAALDCFRERLDELEQLYPGDLEQAATFEQRYLEALERLRPEQVPSWRNRLLSGDNAVLIDRLTAPERRHELLNARRPVDVSVRDINGAEINLGKMRGDVIVIDFWATWCGPCVEEMPVMSQLYDKYQPDGLRIIGISLDHPDGEVRLRKYLEEHKIPWPQCWGNEAKALARRFAVTAIPAVFVIDRSGVIISDSVRGKKLEPLIEKQLRMGR